MANRATLIFSLELDYSRDTAGAGSLAWDYAFAVLWLTLFRETDLQYLHYEEDDHVYKIPYLATTVMQAQANLNIRKLSLLPHLTPSGGLRGLAAMEVILDAAAKQGDKYVILDAWEIWSLGTTDLEILNYIESIDSNIFEPVFAQAYIRQTHFSYKNFDPLGTGDQRGDHPHPYCGYPWTLEDGAVMEAYSATL